MKLKGLNLIAASLLLSMPLAVSADVFIPKSPSITSPLNISNNRATDIPRQPEFEAYFYDQTPLETEWWLFKESENTQGLLFYGGIQPDEEKGFEFLENHYETLTSIYPASIRVQGNLASKIRIYPYGKAELLDSNDTVLNEAFIQPDILSKLRNTSSPYVAVERKSSHITVNWYLEGTSNTGNWDTHLQATFHSDGSVGVRSIINDLSDAFFDIEQGNVGCGLLTSANQIYRETNPLSYWKNKIQEVEEDYFSLLCHYKSGNVAISTYRDVQPIETTIPNFISFSGNGASSVTPAEPLKAGKYGVMARYKATDGTD